MRWAFACFLVCSGVVAADDRAPTAEQRVVDVLWFQNGDRLLGMSLGEDARGKVHFLVERDSLKRQNPKLHAKYVKDEPIEEKQAVADALRRIDEWAARRKNEKRLQEFLLDEKERLVKRRQSLEDGRWTPPPLLYLELPRREVRRIHSPPPERKSLCSRAWSVGMVDVAKKTAKAIADELKKIGGPQANGEPDLSNLVGSKPQDADEWACRTAIAESIQGPRCQLQGTSDFLATVGKEIDFADVAKMLQRAISGESSSPLPDAVAKAERDGCDGLRIDTVSPDGSAAMIVTVHFFVRRPNGRWTAIYRQSERQSTTQVGPDAVDRVAKDPQVESAEKILKGLGLGDGSQWDAAKRAGAATAAALERANARFGRFTQIYGRNVERPRILIPVGN